MLAVGQPREPRLHAVEHLPVGEPLPLLPPPRLAPDEPGGAVAHLVGREELAGREHPRLVDLVGRALVGDGEAREAIDLVTPEVDAHGMVVGRRVHVDDRPAHRDLAARFDLVLAPVSERDEPRDQLVAIELRAGMNTDGLEVLDVRAEALHQRPHGRHDHLGEVLAAGAQLPDHAQAVSHRVERRRHPFERERLPGREQLDRRVTPEVPGEVVGDTLGLGRRRHRDQDRPAGRDPGEGGEIEGPGRLRHRHHRGPIDHGAHGRLLGQQRRELGQQIGGLGLWSSSFGSRWWSRRAQGAPDRCRPGVARSNRDYRPHLRVTDGRAALRAGRDPAPRAAWRDWS